MLGPMHLPIRGPSKSSKVGHRLFAALVPCLLLAAGCADKAATGGPVVPPAATSQGIAWFGGTVDEASAHARAKDLPVFLYWGAEWCPPCHEIKATVFRSSEFIERSRLFVPVYLDGDAENAQALGEKFAVLGYPTMIVFSPAGEEITRIPGGIDIQAYANVLDLAIGAVKPAASILARVLETGAALDVAECRLLAYYSWEQNPALLANRDKAAVFGSLHDACPAALGVERSKLFLAQLDAAVAVTAKGEGAALESGLRAAAPERLLEILGDPALQRANVVSLMLSGARLTAAVTEPGSEARARLQASFAALLDRMARDEQLFQTEPLYALIGTLRFARIDDAEATLPDALLDEIRETVGRIDRATRDPYERQTIINAAAALLEMAGLTDAARALLLAELERSQQPYYFMPGLASIEQEAGDYPAAINWLARGYAESTGPATRFQWGAYYLAGLLEMAPQDEDLIVAEALRVVGELESTRAFYHRPKAQLERLQVKLREWNGDDAHAGAIKRIRQGVLRICAGIPAQDAARATCEAFLAPA
jgi:thiol-disulfide isomerase/thioredoxin